MVFFFLLLIYFAICFAVISELIHHTVSVSSGGLPAQMLLIHVLLPRVMSLKDQLRDSSKVLD